MSSVLRGYKPLKCFCKQQGDQHVDQSLHFQVKKALGADGTRYSSVHTKRQGIHLGVREAFAEAKVPLGLEG